MANTNLSYCTCCEDIVGFRVERRLGKEVFKGKEIEYEFDFGVCEECGTEVSTDIDYASRKLKAKCLAYNALGGKQLRID